MEPKAITEQKKDCTSIHTSTKPVGSKKLSKKEIEETNPLLTKEVTHAVSVTFDYEVLRVCYKSIE